MRNLVRKLLLIVACGAVSLVVVGFECCKAGAGQPAISQEITRVRYLLSSNIDKQTTFYDAVDDITTGRQEDEFEPINQKSPAKAFLLSLAVPGLGQLYYGSKIKPVLFAGAEAAAWILRANYNSDGDDMIAAYEQFNRTHWSENSYSDYLEWSYGERDDENIDAMEISHHLPDTRIQQYYEMTGKYNQFAWGWDDATFEGNMLSDYSLTNPPPRISASELTPYSARRLAYEDMRGAANEKHRNADKMLAVIMVNHLASAFEAFFMTKKRNSDQDTNNGGFGEWKITPSLKSYTNKYDTPYIKVSYKF